MRKQVIRALCMAVAFLVSLWPASIASRAQNSGPQGAEQTPNRRQMWIVPKADGEVPMHAVLYRPEGKGPFPLAIVNHGTSQSPSDRAAMRIDPYPAMADWLVKRGYAVVFVQRPGHGQTGGPFLEDQKSCDDADYRGAGLGAAQSIETALGFFAKQPFVQRSQIILVGHSSSAWGLLALASSNPSQVKAIVAFAAGRGGRINNRPNNNCAPDRLVETAAAFGARSHIPLLAIYVENDSFFPPALSRRIVAAYRAGGAPIEDRLLPAFGREGHWMLDDPESVALWGPVVAEFLQGVR